MSSSTVAVEPNEHTSLDGRRVVDASLFTTIEIDGTVQHCLAGSRCVACAAVAFPAQTSCARCTGQDVEICALPTDGTIWASTVQRFTPKPPYLGAAAAGTTYGVGYVDLGDVFVESRLVGTPEQFSIGTTVSLVLEQLPGTEDAPTWTFAFAPTTAGEPHGDALDHRGGR